jgi:hypothetical protein
LLTGRSDLPTQRQIWRTAEERWATPEATIAEAVAVRLMGKMLGRTEQAESVLNAAEWYAENHVKADAPAAQLAENPFVSQRVAKLAELIAADESDGIVEASTGALRVAGRFFGSDVETVNRSTDGRVLLSRLVGGSILDDGSSLRKSRSAMLGVMVIGDELCRTSNPLCDACPLHAGQP